MKAEPFQTARDDGRSDRQVIYDLVSDASFGTAFSHAQLVEALSEGIDGPIPRQRIYHAVAGANPVLLRERQRYLAAQRGAARGVGYRIINPNEHVSEAVVKKNTAQGYIQRGLALLQGARLEDLDEAQRALHQGQMMVMAGLYQKMQESERRHDRAESLISELVGRVEDLEKRQEK